MSLANCNLGTLSNAAKCFDCLSSTEKQALKIQFIAQAYKVITGVDLTNINTLRKAAACLACEPDFRLESMEVAVWKNFWDVLTEQTYGAQSAQVRALPTTIQAMRALIKCVPCGEQKSTRASYLYLLCRLAQQGDIIQIA